MTRIAFIDDQTQELEPARLLLAADGIEVERHRNGEAAFAVFQRRMPGLVVINFAGQNANGMRLIEQIRAKWALPVIAIGSSGDEVDEILCLRLGADDFLARPASPRRLVARIGAVLRRLTLLADGQAARAGSEPVVAQGDLIMDPNRHEVIWKEQDVVLTATEFALLLSLVRRPGVVKNRDMLMSEVYAHDIFVDDRTIDSHIKRIRKKFRAVDPAFDAIETLYAVGYRFVMPRKPLFLLQGAGQPAARRLAA
jgi:two-component system response regulator ChvI